METKTLLIWVFAAFLAFIEVSTASKESKLRISIAVSRTFPVEPFPNSAGRPEKLRLQGCATCIPIYRQDHEESEVKSLKRRSNPMDDVTDTYDFSDEDLNELMKRGSLFRFGKRGALFRFGKRSEEDKRGSLFRFGKRMDGYYVSPYASSENFPEKDDKRGSLFRFGKRSSLFRFGRSVDNEKPHTPFRFGREEEDEI